MGIQDVRNAFIAAGKGKLRCTECEHHTVPDGNNSQRLIINGFDAAGTPFSLDSGPFDPSINPNMQARSMAEAFIKGQP